MGRGSMTSLAPGFRFHPTDEELVRYYLKRKICNKPFKFDAISVTDVYKSEPWDLPDKSKLKSRDLEWYFFSRAPRGERTNWVMHEYRLVDQDLDKTGVHQDAFVLCRIFQKSGSGPKNGEQYGAPFVEEEWEEEDDMTFVPDQEDLGSEDHVYINMDDIDQKSENLVVYDAIPIPLNFIHGESSNNVETNYSDSVNYIQPGNYVDSGGYFEQPAESYENDQKPIVRDGNLQNGEIGCGVQDEHTENLQSSDNIFGTDTSCYNDFPVESNYLTGEAFMDPNINLMQNDGLYLETNDLSSTQQDGFDFEDYLTFFDEDDENAQNLTFDPSQLMGNEDIFVDQEELFQEVETKELKKEETSGSKHVVEEKEKDEASCSKQVDADATEFEPDYKYPFLKKASHMLGAIPAPPAFASEFPTKDASIRLHAAQSSGSVHVTAGMITISDRNTVGWSYGKNENLDLILSLGLVQGNTSSEKSGDSSAWAMLIFMCLWVLVLSVSFKVSILVSSR
ncbi:unnamed protein product [Arabidopsis arenosa]|uniref:NAC domain-containing protein n=1 Tax=Arabidopsis arenosa TaxID=38785 RepID=A0A8S1ZTV3_ARAAE|nr:unnamed protein product [Arabidopsis arenosa]